MSPLGKVEMSPLGKVEMSPLGKVEMSPFVPRKPTLLRVLNGMENTNARGAIHNEHRRARVIEKRLTQAIASRQVGVTVRQIKRLVKKYRDYGAEGLISKQRGQVSNHKYTADKIEAIKGLVKKHYYDFGPKFAAEKLMSFMR
jgi:hypothetical protein